MQSDNKGDKSYRNYLIILTVVLTVIITVVSLLTIQ